MTAARRWHVGRWGPLGALETAVKGVALVYGLAAGARALGRDQGWPGGADAVQLAVLALLTLGLVGAIGDRYVEREVTAMVFVVPNVVAHAGMTLAVASQPGPGGVLTAFAALMLAGEVVKIVFLRTTRFTVRNVGTDALVALTGLYAAGYAALLLLQL